MLSLLDIPDGFLGVVKSLCTKLFLSTEYPVGGNQTGNNFLLNLEVSHCAVNHNVCYFQNLSFKTRTNFLGCLDSINLEGPVIYY